MASDEGKARRVQSPENMAAHAVPDFILRSWERSTQFGLHRETAARIEPLTDGELRIALDKHGELIHLCKAEIDAFARIATSNDSLAALGNSEGLILLSHGADQFTRRARNASLCPGALWSERLQGTNGIAAALAERRAVSVCGPWHFFDANGFMTCSAGPIFTPYGYVAGVFNLSSLKSTVAPLTRALVELAVDQIEHRFFAHDFEGYEIMRFHLDHDLLGTAREGILVFEGSKLVAANRYGLAFAHLDWDMLGRCNFDELFEGKVQSGKKGIIRDHAGRAFHYASALKPASPQIPARGPVPAPFVSSRLDPIYSAAERHEIERASRVLESGLSVIVTGETGTGKEVLARRLHAASKRAERPFIAINCAALPESLIESELFGYTEGAFTGARKRGSQGLLRAADGGFLFLDEIGDMPLGLQARLLRVLQEREVTPLGSTRPAPVDFFLICATHCDLQDAVARGHFRQDLFYRIAQFQITLKPLRETRDLAHVIAALWSDITQCDPRYRLASGMMERLAAYHWPGNYRQLNSVLRSLAALAEPGLPLPDSALPKDIQVHGCAARPADGLPAPDSLKDLTQSIMIGAIKRHNGNMTRAAHSLGINRSTLYRRLKADYKEPSKP